jgi:hypothetical protein
MPYTSKDLAKNEATMRLGEALPVDLVTWEKKRSPGEVRLLRMRDEERRARAWKFLFACTGMSLLAVVFPPHFIWPVLGVSIGFGGFFVRRRQTDRLLGGRAQCPECGALQLIAPEPAEFPFTHFCSECRKRCLVERRSIDS